MSESGHRPLVTVALVAYNQQRFIGEAVQSALAQTYSPLEIILSDDCSQDRSFEIMRRLAEAYRGPHRVVLNRNETNRGFIGNLNHTWELAKGEFIVTQAGDDVSLPRRAELLVKAWREPSPVDLVVSDVSVIDEQGREIRRGWPDPVATPLTLEEAVSAGRCYALGCSSGYSRQLITTFGYIEPTVIQEDWVLAFRALVERGIRVVDEPLLKYRKHGNNVWFGQRIDKKAPTRPQCRRFASNRLGILREWLKAWDRSGRPSDHMRRHLVALERQWRYDLACYESGRIGALWLALRGLREGLPLRAAGGLAKRHVLRWGSLGGPILSHA